jgi:hypothetical protein
MKILIATFAVTLALALPGPVFAGGVTTAETEADCVKAGGTWNATTNMCEEKKMSSCPFALNGTNDVGFGRPALFC